MKTSTLIVVGAVALVVVTLRLLEEATQNPDEIAMTPRASRTHAAARIAHDADSVTPPAARITHREVAPWDVKPFEEPLPAHYIPAWTLQPPRPDVHAPSPPPTEPVRATQDDATIDGSRPPR